MILDLFIRLSHEVLYFYFAPCHGMCVGIRTPIIGFVFDLHHIRMGEELSLFVNLLALCSRFMFAFMLEM